MREKQEELVKFLLQQDQPIPSRILSKKIQVSIRTVKNYIAEINKLTKQTVIFSSNLGYSVDREAAEQLLESARSPEALPQSYKDRAFFIIKKLLIEHAALNIFDLSEELFVSYSTLKADIFRMNTTFSKYQVKFVIKQDVIQIIGEEKEKRRLISYIIFEEMPYQFMDQEILAQNFCKADVQRLSMILQSVLKESNYHLNDFSFINLMLHLLILIDSVRNDKSLVSRDWFSSWLKEDKAILATRIIQEIEKQFKLTLNELEKEEVHMLFQANANYIPSNNIKDLEQIIDTEMLDIVNLVLADVRQTFGINLSSESFIVSFALHLSGLFSRAKQASFLKNPMLNSLKKDFPIVYDIAVFVSLRLGELFQVSISEDETAYIALHIGAELEGQKRNFSKISTVLLCPKYMNLDEKLYAKLTQQFGNDLNIKAVLSQFTGTETLKFDLLITTLPVPQSTGYPVIKLSPIFTEDQRVMLVSEIANIRLNRKKRILAQNFDDYFSDKFFTIVSERTQQDQIIQKMCQQLAKEEIITDDFYAHVLERENASSTAFESVAIPHSVYMEANRTTISVAISERGIDWQGQKVHIVLLAAINDLDRQLFTDIYEALISLFDYPEIYSELKKINSFQEFRSFIQSKIKLDRN